MLGADADEPRAVRAVRDGVRDCNIRVVDPASRTLTYGAAGHPSPLLVRATGHVESLDERGTVLGFLPDARYTSATVRDLAAGDRIVFYTDGITEASRGDGEFFGDRQFHDVLTTGVSQSTDRFLTTLVDRARQWTGMDFEDDVTVVVVDWVQHPTWRGRPAFSHALSSSLAPQRFEWIDRRRAP